MFLTVAIIQHNRPFHAVKRIGFGITAVVRTPSFGVGVFALFDGIVAGFHFDFHAEFLVFRHDVVDFQRFHADRTAYAGADVAVCRCAFFHIHAADKVRVDVVAVGYAFKSSPYADCLFRAVYRYWNFAFALNAAYVGVERAAVARVAAVNSRHAAD